MSSAQVRQRPAQSQSNGESESGLWGFALKLLGVLTIAMLFAIILEWLGMAFYWPEKGDSHSAALVQQELTYLNTDFHRSLVISQPAQFAAASGRGLRAFFERTRLDDAIHRQEQATKNKNAFLGGGMRSWLDEFRLWYQSVTPYVKATMNTVELFGIRVAVLGMALPAYVFFGVAAFTDGLVERDIRRWSGGRESAFVYHHAKRLVSRAIFWPWLAYLAMPYSLHPNWIVLPSTVLFGVVLAITVSKFKKYM